MKKIDKEECPYCEERILLDYDPQELDWSMSDHIEIEKICPLCERELIVEILFWKDEETKIHGYNIINAFKRK